MVCSLGGWSWWVVLVVGLGGCYWLVVLVGGLVGWYQSVVSVLCLSGKSKLNFSGSKGIRGWVFISSLPGCSL